MVLGLAELILYSKHSRSLLDFASLSPTYMTTLFINRNQGNLTMTPLLEQAIVKVTQLPSLQQDAIASLIFEELLDELEWDNRFAESQNQLAKLAK